MQHKISIRLNRLSLIPDTPSLSPFVWTSLRPTPIIRDLYDTSLCKLMEEESLFKRPRGGPVPATRRLRAD
jgi:hypothetical protein